MEKFFGEFFRLIKQADPSTYGAFLQRAEEEFKRQGWREEMRRRRLSRVLRLWRNFEEV